MGWPEVAGSWARAKELPVAPMQTSWSGVTTPRSTGFFLEPADLPHSILHFLLQGLAGSLGSWTHLRTEYGDFLCMLQDANRVA